MDEFIDLDKASPEEILAAIDRDPAVIAAKVQLATEAAEYAKSISPEESGTYKDNINVHQNGSAVWVGFDDEKANIVEYGAAEGKPEFAIRAKTEEHFNG